MHLTCMRGTSAMRCPDSFTCPSMTMYKTVRTVKTRCRTVTYTTYSAVQHCHPGSKQMQFFQPYLSSYPADLNTIREGVLASLANDPQETQKLLSCRCTSQCHSVFCPSCLRVAGSRQKRRLLQAAGRIPESRLKFATLTAKYVPLDGLREAGQALIRAGRSTLKRAGIADYALRLETSYAEGQTGFHPHVHALINTPAGGRKYISSDTWTNEWLDVLPMWLHPSQDAAHVKPVRNLEASCSYLSKSAFAACADASAAMIHKIVASTRVTKGVQKFNLRGSLAA
jgi:hypothetical protein